ARLEDPAAGADRHRLAADDLDEAPLRAAATVRRGAAATDLVDDVVGLQPAERRRVVRQPQVVVLEVRRLARQGLAHPAAQRGGAAADPLDRRAAAVVVVAGLLRLHRAAVEVLARRAADVAVVRGTGD